MRRITEMIRIGNVCLTEKWDKLIEKKEFNRPCEEGKLHIEYGIEMKGNEYAFFVSGTEDGKEVTTNMFFQENDEGMFKKQLNRLRKLRPGGQDRKPGRQDDLPAGMEKCGFSCQDPTDSRSLLLRPLLGTLVSTDSCRLNFNWNVYPNLMPFEPAGHFLLVPSAHFPELPHFPQLLTPALIEDFFSICKASMGLMIFFNCRHAGATQDHFHLQAVSHTTQLPIEKIDWKSFKEGPLQYIGDPYPLNAVVYNLLEDKDACSKHIRKLQTKDSNDPFVPFNLIFLGRSIFLVPRDINNEIVPEFPNLLASMEICGKFILSEQDVFDNATQDRIRVALGRIGLSLDCIV